MEIDLDDKTPVWSSGASKQAALKEITIVAAAGLTRPNLPPRLQKDIERILKLAEEGLNYG